MDIRLNDFGRRDWDALVSQFGGALQQSWQYGESVAGFPGRNVDRYVIFQNGQAAMAAQLLRRRLAFKYELRLLSRGPIFDAALPACDRAQLFRAFNRQISGKLPNPIFVTPDLDTGFQACLKIAPPGLVAELDLRPAESDLHAALNGKWRNRLSFARRSGVEIVRSSCFDWILEREAENRARHKYRGPSAKFFLHWRDHVNDWVLFQARNRGKSIAGALFFLHAGRASYQIGWSGEVGRRMNAQNLVLWQAIRHLRKRGCRRLELGPIEPEKAPGLTRFKLGTGADIVSLGATVAAVPSLGIGAGIAHLASRLSLKQPLREK